MSIKEKLNILLETLEKSTDIKSAVGSLTEQELSLLSEDTQDLDDESKATIKKISSIVSKSNNADVANYAQDIAALTEGETLTEGFKAKAATIFEAAVTSKVNDKLDSIQEELNSKYETEAKGAVSDLVESVDGYLNLMVEKWLNDNVVEVESNVKSIIFEDFVGGLKSLFEQTNISIPKEKIDLLQELQTKYENLSEELNSATKLNVEITRSLQAMKRKDIVESASKGLSATDAEKLNSLAKDIEFNDEETFESKVKTIRESYFGNKRTSKTLSEVFISDKPPELNEDINLNQANPQMRPYLDFFNKTTSK